MENAMNAELNIECLISEKIKLHQDMNINNFIPRQLHTGCPTKNDTLFWRAVAPLKLGIKVGGVLESSGSQH